ncbi:unnamed protein product [Zymoseptoria tritici ST99CH_3D7]|uniref:Uncharacterized protein n=1 Tax=Zymoseptoria tritici (strain ST99CH_3D7) TaxID=1276538 RepID=A0A1X7RXS1_ZYMT9|nr:unnamed protein product [Zymoseptoria tritici ST99CH_3D7]
MLPWKTSIIVALITAASAVQDYGKCTTAESLGEQRGVFPYGWCESNLITGEQVIKPCNKNNKCTEDDTYCQMDEASPDANCDRLH